MELSKAFQLFFFCFLDYQTHDVKSKVDIENFELLKSRDKNLFGIKKCKE